MPRPTLFRELLQERRWDNWCIFAAHLDRAARDLARQGRSTRVLGVSIARRTFDRWMIGELESLPHRDTQVATEYLLGFPFDALFGPPRSTSGPASREDERGQPGAEASEVGLAGPQPRRGGQRETAMQAFDERPGG